MLEMKNKLMFGRRDLKLCFLKIGPFLSKIRILTMNMASIAQLASRESHNLEVMSSVLTRSINCIYNLFDNTKRVKRNPFFLLT